MAKKGGSKLAQMRAMREQQVKEQEAAADPEVYYAERVVAQLAKTAADFIEVGALLVEAKANIPHGRWEAWVQERLPLSLSSAKRYMAIGARFSKSPNLGVLPPAEGTLYDLAQLDEDEWALVRKEVGPETTRREVASLVESARRKLGRIPGPRAAQGNGGPPEREWDTVGDPTPRPGHGARANEGPARAAPATPAKDAPAGPAKQPVGAAEARAYQEALAQFVAVLREATPALVATGMQAIDIGEAVKRTTEARDYCKQLVVRLEERGQP